MLVLGSPHTAAAYARISKEEGCAVSSVPGSLEDPDGVADLPVLPSFASFR
jgi:hypothetical protein